MLPHGSLSSHFPQAKTAGRSRDPRPRRCALVQRMRIGTGDRLDVPRVLIPAVDLVGIPVPGLGVPGIDPAEAEISDTLIIREGARRVEVKGDDAVI